MLRNLVTMNDGETYSLLFTNQASVMLGTVFRASKTGVNLLIAHSFLNYRDAEQGLKRVG